jgi:hypothetical protein
MGPSFLSGSTRQVLIRQRCEDRKCRYQDGTRVFRKCLAHCYRGSPFAGVLWTVWEQTFQCAGRSNRPAERWIGCDRLRYHTGYGWGYMDMDERMHPNYYSCPLKYLALVPLTKFGGNREWRRRVKQHHTEVKKKTAARRLAA